MSGRCLNAWFSRHADPVAVCIRIGRYAQWASGQVTGQSLFGTFGLCRLPFCPPPSPRELPLHDYFAIPQVFALRPSTCSPPLLLPRCLAADLDSLRPPVPFDTPLVLFPLCALGLFSFQFHSTSSNPHGLDSRDLLSGDNHQVSRSPARTKSSPHYLVLGQRDDRPPPRSR